MKKFLIIILSIVLLSSNVMAKGEISTLKDSAKKISEIKIPKEVEIVSFGEQTHGSEKLQLYKWEIFKNLIDDGYTNFLLECNYEAGKLVNDYIHGKINLSAEEVTKKANFFVYKTEEMKTVFESMKKYNDSHDKKINVYGFDMESFYFPMKEFLKEYKDIDSKAANKYKKVLNIFKDDAVIFKDEQKRKIATILLNEIKKDYNTKSSKINSKELKNKMDYLLKISEEFMGWINSKYSVDFRDKCLFENIKLIDKIEGGKLFVCAHNMHVAKNGKYFNSFGKLLKGEYKNKYYTIGTDIYDIGFVARDEKSTVKNKVYKDYNYINSKDKLMVEFLKTDLNEALYQFNEMDKEALKIFEDIYTTSTFGTMYGESYKKDDSKVTIQMKPVKDYDAMILINKDVASKTYN